MHRASIPKRVNIHKKSTSTTNISTTPKRTISATKSPHTSSTNKHTQPITTLQACSITTSPKHRKAHTPFHTSRNTDTDPAPHANESLVSALFQHPTAKSHLKRYEEQINCAMRSSSLSKQDILHSIFKDITTQPELMRIIQQIALSHVITNNTGSNNASFFQNLGDMQIHTRQAMYMSTLGKPGHQAPTAIPKHNQQQLSEDLLNEDKFNEILNNVLKQVDKTSDDLQRDIAVELDIINSNKNKKTGLPKSSLTGSIYDDLPHDPVVPITRQTITPNHFKPNTNTNDPYELTEQFNALINKKMKKTPFDDDNDLNVQRLQPITIKLGSNEYDEADDANSFESLINKRNEANDNTTNINTNTHTNSINDAGIHSSSSFSQQMHKLKQQREASNASSTFTEDVRHSIDTSTNKVLGDNNDVTSFEAARRKMQRDYETSQHRLQQERKKIYEETKKRGVEIELGSTAETITQKMVRSVKTRMRTIRGNFWQHRHVESSTSRLKKRGRINHSSGFDHDTKELGQGMSLLSALLAALFFAIISILTAFLCNWQLNRRLWKEGLIEDREEGLLAEPTPLESLVENKTDFLSNLTQEQRAEVLETLSMSNISFDQVMVALAHLKEEISHHNIFVDGRFDYTKELFVGPTVPPLENGQFRKVEMNKGYFVITPLQLYEPIRFNMPVAGDDGEVLATIPLVIHEVLVNRGWIPASLIKTYLANPLTEHEMMSPQDMTMVANIIHNQRDADDPPSLAHLQNMLDTMRIIPPNNINIEVSQQLIGQADGDNELNESNSKLVIDVLPTSGDVPVAPHAQQDVLKQINEHSICNNHGLNRTKLEKVGLGLNDVFQFNMKEHKLEPLVSDRSEPVRTPLQRVSGIVHFGHTVDMYTTDEQTAKIKMRGTDGMESYQFITPPKFGVKMGLSPTTMHLPGGNTISLLQRQHHQDLDTNKANNEATSLQIHMPICVIDSVDPAIQRRTLPHPDEQKTHDTVRLALTRKSIDDHLMFKTTPETHLGYAATWGSFSAVSGVMALSILNKRVVRNAAQDYFGKMLGNTVQQQARSITSQVNPSPPPTPPTPPTPL